MSIKVTYSTQIGSIPTHTQGSTNEGDKWVLVYPAMMSPGQTELMLDARCLLSDKANLAITTPEEIRNLSTLTRCFIIPCLRDDLVKLIRSHSEKPIIYTARVICEALRYRKTKLPVRSLAISMTMMKCYVFLVRSINKSDLKNMVNLMSGTILEDFSDHRLNVVVTDRADNKYNWKARSRGITVVSTEWIHETFSLSKSEESNLMFHDASTTISDHQIKPFSGLKFKINIPQLTKPLRNLIGNNDGKLVFGDEGMTHIVSSSIPSDDQDGHDSTGKSDKGPRIVDVEFLEVCANLGHYLTRKEYQQYQEMNVVKIKQEKQSQLASSRTNFSSTSQPFQRSTLSSIRSNGYENRLNENQSMLPPPPTMPRPTRQQMSDSMNDLILRQLENGTQVQTASTQIRRLPEPEIQFEPTLEPSQQLYWNDSVSRRH